jgi:hypothetical protein
MAGVKGAKRGVRRGVGGNGAILTNGHYPIPARLRSVILDLLSVRGRTTGELADLLRYSTPHIRRVMRDLVTDGEVLRLGSKGMKVAWTLPTDEVIERKLCARCDTWKPIYHFGKDRQAPDGLRYACKICRSEYAAALEAGVPPVRKGPAPKPVDARPVRVVASVSDLSFEGMFGTRGR